MSIELRWWEDEAVLEYRCEGKVDGAELVAANRQALADPRFAHLRCQICDMEDVTAFEINKAEIDQIVDIDMKAKEVAPACSQVAIASEEDLIFGFARMYEMTLEGREPGWETRVFRTREEALQWLDLEEET